MQITEAPDCNLHFATCILHFAIFYCAAGVLLPFAGASANRVPPFFGGALGYVSYNAVEQFHDIANGKKDPLGLPEIFFVFVQTLVAFDNLKHTIKVIDNVQITEQTDLRKAYDMSVKRIRKVISSLQKKPRGIETRDLSRPAATANFART